MKYPILTLIHGLTILGFYGWANGSHLAAELVQVWLWTLSILTLMVFSFALGRNKPPPPRPDTIPAWRIFTRVNGAGTMAALVWLGAPVLATAYAMTWLIMVFNWFYFKDTK